MQETISIKVSPVEKARFKAEAERRGLRLSTLLRMGMEAVTSNAAGAGGPTCYELAARFFEKPGHIDSSGLGDLSSNKARLRGFGTKS